MLKCDTLQKTSENHHVRLMAIESMVESLGVCSSG